MRNFKRLEFAPAHVRHLAGNDALVVAMGDEDLDERTVTVDPAVDPPALLGHVHELDLRLDVRPGLKGAVQ
eukprot:scaffold27110_cov61-Phaeocystis_antarctica.AAC.3